MKRHRTSESFAFRTISRTGRWPSNVERQLEAPAELPFCWCAELADHDTIEVMGRFFTLNQETDSMNRIGQIGLTSFLTAMLLGVLCVNARLTAEEARPEKDASIKTVSLERAEARSDLPAPPKEVLESMLKMHNDVRVRRGLRPFRLHTRLTAAAQRFADYSHRTGRFGHYADGRSPSDRISAEGVSYGSWAENMAWGQGTAESAMNTWLNSSGHHGNILSGHTHVGFGQVGGVWVTVFANVAETEEAG